MNGLSSKFFAAVFVALACFSLFAGAAINPKVQLENYSLSVQPLSPGGTATLTVHLKSLEYDVCAERVGVKLAVNYPLSVQGPDTQYIDVLCSVNSYDNSTLYFKLAADPLAQSGTYQIAVATNYEKSFLKFSESNTIAIKVQGEAGFQAQPAASEPVDVYPGDSSSVTVKVSNNGTGRAEAASVTFSAAYGVEVKWAGKTALLGTIQPKTSSSATFQVEALKSVPAGNYPITATVSYLDEDGSSKQKQFSFMLPVKAKAEFTAGVQNAENGVVIGDKQIVSLQLRNTGSQTARKLKVTLIPVYPFSTDGTVRYIESLAAGAFTPLDYAVTVDKEAGQGGQLLKLSVEFEDPRGKKFSDTADFALQVRSKSLLEEAQGFWWLGAIIALAVAISIARKARKQK